MNGGHYTAFVRLDSGTDIDFDDIHLPHPDSQDKVSVRLISSHSFSFDLIGSLFRVKWFQTLRIY